MLEDLTTRGLLTESDGAKCIFVPKRKVPLMVQKTDGGYGYDTTDLAALRYRVHDQGASWIIYVTDEGQKLHFDTVIDAGKQVGYYDPAVTRYDHVGFGLVLQVMPGEEESKTGEAKPAAPKEAKGKAAKEAPKKEGAPKEEEKKEDPKKPKVGKMKTREGDSTKLMDLLDEAKNRTLEIFRERMQEDDEEGNVHAQKV